MDLKSMIKSDLDKRNVYYYELGFEEGKRKILEELIKVIGLDEYIAEAIDRHTEQEHD